MAETRTCAQEFRQTASCFGSLRPNCNIDNSTVYLKREHFSPAVHAELQRCQPTSTVVNMSFSILGKLLRSVLTERLISICGKVPVYYIKLLFGEQILKNLFILKSNYFIFRLKNCPTYSDLNGEVGIPQNSSSPSFSPYFPFN